MARNFVALAASVNSEVDPPASEVLGPKAKTKNLLFCGMYLVVAWQRN